MTRPHHFSATPYYVPEHRTMHIKKILTTTWKLEESFKDSVLINHFMLYWQGTYFKEQLSDGCIYKDGRLFRVIYHNCFPESCYSALQIALSFRVPHHRFNINPVVLVSCAPAVQRRKTGTK